MNHPSNPSNIPFVVQATSYGQQLTIEPAEPENETSVTTTEVPEEVRVVDPNTGGEKGQKEAQLGAIDPRSIMEIAKVAGFGARKYARMNFMKGYAYSLSYDALQRHLHAFWDGEEKDPESGLAHLAHAGWHCLALLSFTLRGLGTDDRYKGSNSEGSYESSKVFTDV